MFNILSRKSISAIKAMLIISGVTISLFAINLSYALPTGAEVAAGSVAITSPAANEMHIQQHTSQSIINWQSYNINAHERVHYQQPNAASISLNRINPNQGVSKIYGRLTSNGQVWLVNPAGVWFGPSARVDVAGLLATTASISNEDFLAGRYLFTQSPEWHGAIINEGIIQVAEAGLLALIGTGVVNNGLIEAHLGTVVMAAGNQFTVNFSGNELISFAVEQEVMEAAVDASGNHLRDGVANTGTIIANGGRIMVNAKTASDILDHTINMKGIAQAKSVSVNNGTIILDGGDGVVKISGQLVASGKGTTEKGGTVKVTGKIVALSDDALIDVSGDQGGGTVLVGGNAHGVGPESNAQYTWMGANAQIHADALTVGHGGKVVLWADNGTYFYGNITARGGVLQGDGGWVETSGKAYLEAMGLVTANAVNGKAGSWLLDPANVTISGGATTNGTFDGGNPNQFTTTANTAVANVTTITNSLDAGTSVTILTTPSGTQAGNITVSSAISKTAGGDATLTLDAVGTITVNANISSSSNKLHVVLTAGNSITIGSTASSAISTLGGDFTATAQNTVTLSTGVNPGTIDVDGGKVTINANQDGAGAQAFTMAVGSSISSDSTASDAVSISVNSAVGGTGAATLRSITTGNGGSIQVTTATGGNTTGTDITLAAGTLDTGSGTISLTTPQITGNNIGTSGAPIQIVASQLSATTGTSGVFITNSGTSGLDLNTINATGAFTLNSTSSSGITDSGATTVTGTTTIVAGSTQDVTLNHASNDFATLAITSVDDATIVDVDDIIMGASTISGAFHLTAGGAVTQSAALSVTGLTTLDSGANDISLITATNEFSTVIISAAVNAAIRDATALIVGTSTASNSLSFTAGGDLTQSGAITTPNLTAMTRLTGGAVITLDNAANEVTTIDLRARNTGNTANAPGAITYRDATGFDVAAANSTSTVTLTAGDAITQSGAMAGTTLTVKTLNNAGAAITLNNASNALTTVHLQARNAADTANTAGDITYQDVNAVIINGIDTAGNLTFTAGGNITQSGVLTVTGTPSFTVSGSGSDILLASAANDFSTTPVLTTSGAGTIDIALRNISATASVPILPASFNSLTLIFDNNAIVLPQLTLTSTLNVTASGAITQTGALTISGVTTLSSGAANDITLNDTSNNFSTLSVTDGHHVQLHDSNAMIFGNMTVSGNLEATTNGAMTDSGTLLVTGDAILSAGAANDITLNTATNDFNTVSISNTDDATIVDVDNIILGISAVDVYTLTTGGAITQSGALTIGGVFTMNPGAANNITLTDASNNFSTATITAANDVALVDSNALNLGSGSNISGNLTVTTGGALTDGGAITVSGASGLTATAVGGIVLNNNNSISIMNLHNSGSGNVTIVSVLPLTISGFSQSGGGTVSFTDTGTLSIANGVSITSSDANISITATDLDLNATGMLNSGTANISITQNTANGSVGIGNAIGNMSISGAELSRMTANDLTINAPTDGDTFVDGVVAANVANIADTVTLAATAGTLGDITFQTTASIFNQLTANADNGITVNVGVTTATGNLVLNADAGGGAGGNDALLLGDNLTAAGSMSLSALNGGIQLNAPITLTANSIDINHAVDGAFNLILDAGAGTTSLDSTVGATTPIGTGVGAAIQILSTGATTFSNTVNTNSGITASGPVTFANIVNLGDGSIGSTFDSAVTLSGAITYTFTGEDGLAFNGGLTTSGASKNMASHGADIVLGQSSNDAITLNSALIVVSDGGNVTVNGTVSGANALNVNTGVSSGNVIFNNLNTNRAATITANHLSGTVRLSHITIDLFTGNFGGTVGGSAGVTAIKQYFTVLNTLVPGRIFFNGIDIALVANPSFSNAPAQIVFPTNYTSMIQTPALETNYANLESITNSCLTITPLITLCGEWDE